MNKKLWNYYKQSSDGQNAITMFNPETDDVYQKIENIATFLQKLNGYIKPQHFADRVFVHEVNLVERNLLIEELSERKNFETFVESYDLKEFEIQEEKIIWFEENYFIKADKFRQKAATIDALSMYLYFYDAYFKPILLPRRFDIIQKSCDALGIELPPIPRTKSYKEYLMYYYDICGAINKFQVENGLTDAEVCACIYDYGARVLLEEGKQENEELPPPTNVWLTGGSGKGDFEFLDSLGKDSQAQTSIWACNERTRKGDLVIIYCTSPRSFIHSIWRAESCWYL